VDVKVRRCLWRWGGGGSSVSWIGWEVWVEVEWRENMPEDGQDEEGGKE